MEAIRDLLVELKALHEYNIKLSFVECGGSKRFLDFQSIAESNKVPFSCLFYVNIVPTLTCYADSRFSWYLKKAQR